ncbi:EscU/YscU/HrcU family type III secretion system export apparatus switch protein [Litchfieldia alkalitelluris]|uniref:EscU/YscU/HrcU family type III secretion system export apparatus switch protein n=1 Tax=Litchfieldia alkalitelluris TaxID=304268 RepID=UPI000998A947|nr:EscU/YscU/HrcU family type III secretion system export apparatus switch protein [Litchfieldia alkalitelluris]
MSTSKTKKAVALKYQPEIDDAPQIVGKGKGIVAENIINAAKEHHVPIEKDESLTQLLSEIEMNEKIPEELYGVVAEIFAFIYQADKFKSS